MRRPKKKNENKIYRNILTGSPVEINDIDQQLWANETKHDSIPWALKNKWTIQSLSKMKENRSAERITSNSF